ncbi:MAG: class I SAM-dependent methyltransferase [Pseudomonadota bacterium]
MNDKDNDQKHWADVAEEWIAWARAPGHDAFWNYAQALRAFLGHGSSAALDVGCGEGRVSRLLKELGYRVTAVDPVGRFIDAAREMNSADHYEVAPVAALPFKDARFDLAIAYNMLMDVEDVPAAAREIRRVLKPSGTLIVSIVHPFADRGHFAGPDADAPFIVPGSYFGRERFEGVEEKNGLKMHFAGWSQPLETYMAALAGAGFAVTEIKEPVPEGPSRWARMPLFLWLKARPLPA